MQHTASEAATSTVSDLDSLRANKPVAERHHRCCSWRHSLSHHMPDPGISQDPDRALSELSHQRPISYLTSQPETPRGKKPLSNVLVPRSLGAEEFVEASNSLAPMDTKLTVTERGYVHLGVLLGRGFGPGLQRCARTGMLVHEHMDLQQEDQTMVPLPKVEVEQTTLDAARDIACAFEPFPILLGRRWSDEPIRSAPRIGNRWARHHPTTTTEYPRLGTRDSTRFASLRSSETSELLTLCPRNACSYHDPCDDVPRLGLTNAVDRSGMRFAPVRAAGERLEAFECPLLTTVGDGYPTGTNHKLQGLSEHIVHNYTCLAPPPIESASRHASGRKRARFEDVAYSDEARLRPSNKSPTRLLEEPKSAASAGGLNEPLCLEVRATDQGPWRRASTGSTTNETDECPRAAVYVNVDIVTEVEDLASGTEAHHNDLMLELDDAAAEFAEDADAEDSALLNNDSRQSDDALSTKEHVENEDDSDMFGDESPVESPDTEEQPFLEPFLPATIVADLEDPKIYILPQGAVTCAAKDDKPIDLALDHQQSESDGQIFNVMMPVIPRLGESAANAMSKRSRESWMPPVASKIVRRLSDTQLSPSHASVDIDPHRRSYSTPDMQRMAGCAKLWPLVGKAVPAECAIAAWSWAKGFGNEAEPGIQPFPLLPLYLEGLSHCSQKSPSIDYAHTPPNTAESSARPSVPPTPPEFESARIIAEETEEDAVDDGSPVELRIRSALHHIRSLSAPAPQDYMTTGYNGSDVPMTAPSPDSPCRYSPVTHQLSNLAEVEQHFRNHRDSVLLYHKRMRNEQHLNQLLSNSRDSFILTKKKYEEKYPPSMSATKMSDTHIRWSRLGGLSPNPDSSPPNAGTLDCQQTMSGLAATLERAADDVDNDCTCRVKEYQSAEEKKWHKAMYKREKNGTLTLRLLDEEVPPSP